MTALEPVLGNIQKRLAGGEALALRAVLEAIQKPQESQVPERIPLPAVLTDEQRAALDRFHDVFGSVVPTERRSLTNSEVTALLDERQILGTIESLMSARKTDIATTMHNHFDVVLEEQGVPDGAIRDEKGWLVADSTSAVSAERRQKFTREIREGAPSVSVEDLRALAADPDSGFTHEDFLACTTQVRVLDEAKMTLHLRSNPKIVGPLSTVVTPGRKTSAIYPRKA